MIEEVTKGFTTEPNKKVQGCALYAEFKNEYGQVFQMFLTPDGYNEEDVYTPARAFYRRLSPTATKKQWQTQIIRRELVDEATGSTTQEHRLSRLETIDFLMKRVAISSTLVAKPFFVEVSKKDLSDIRAGKTPTKVIYRIGQCRTALAYPELFTA